MNSGGFRAKAPTKEEEKSNDFELMSPWQLLLPASISETELSPAPGQRGPHPAYAEALTGEQPVDIN